MFVLLGAVKIGETRQRQRKELVAKQGKAEILSLFSPKFKLISKTEAHLD